MELTAPLLKLHLLAEGIKFTDGFLSAFGADLQQMPKRRAYNNPDHRSLPITQRVPQEIVVDGITIAANYRTDTAWSLDHDGLQYFIALDGEPVCPVQFSKYPNFLSETTSAGVPCAKVANLYGGSSLAFFTPSTCYYFSDNNQCHFCSLEPTRGSDHFFTNVISPKVAADVLQVAQSADPGLINQIMLVGGNLRNYDLAFQRNMDLVDALLASQQGESAGGRVIEPHVATMPPRNLGLLKAHAHKSCHLTFNLEVWDDAIFEAICPGKALDYSRAGLKEALFYAAELFPHGRVHTILIAGLEPVASTIEGMWALARGNVSPIINVFHNDRGSRLEFAPRPSFEDLHTLALELETVYQAHDIQPYWKGCGRNALDFEAQHGWFSSFKALPNLTDRTTDVRAERMVS
jgi:hypothetical protein